MRTLRRFALAGLALFLLTGLVGWLFWFSGWPRRLPPWTPDMQAVADGNNRFAFDLYRELRTTPGNLFVSPYSAHAVLALTSTGARGTTRDQMAKVLHFPPDPDTALAAGDVGRYYAHQRKEFELAVANGLWGRAGYPWRPEFLQPARERFGAGLTEANFAGDPDGERVRINRWAEDQTRGRIKELLAPGLVTPDHRLVLVNAIYFKGQWQERFDPARTLPLPFTLADGTKVTVPMMGRKGGFRRFVEPGPDHRWGEPALQVAELPYKGGELSMVLLVPGRPDGLPALEERLSADALAGWLAAAQEEKDAGLSLPRFRLEPPTVDLKPPLRRLGMEAAFDRAAADFTGLHTSGEQLYIDFAVQKAFVEVNEAGTEAAAATAVGVVKTSASFDVRADRPFLFLIRDTRRGTILFLGRVADPR